MADIVEYRWWKRVNAICEDAEIVLAYLPPYSPDLNPIEEGFAEIKA